MIVFMDGFDYYNTADMVKRWVNLSGTISTDYACGTGQGLSLGQNTSNYISVKDISSFVCGFNFYLSGIPGSNANIISFRESGTEHVSVRVNASSYLTFTRNGTVLGTSSNTIPFKVWNHIEIKSTIHDTAGTYEVRLNGAGIGISGSGADTRNGATGLINQVVLQGDNNGSAPKWVDDFYLLDSAPPLNNFIGVQKIFLLRTAKPGTYSEFTPAGLPQNFANVNISNMVSSALMDATFNYDASGSHIDSFDMQNTPVSGSVNAVQAIIVAKQDIGTPRLLSDYVLLSGSAVSGSPVFVSSTYQFLAFPHDTDPANRPWTADNVNSAEFGYRTY